MTNTQEQVIAETEKNVRKINLERIVGTTVGYGLIGSFFPESYAIAPILSTTGLLFSAYDEIKQTGINLDRPITGIAIGGVIGSFFEINANSYLPHIATYACAMLIGSIGLYKSLLIKNERFTNEEDI